MQCLSDDYPLPFYLSGKRWPTATHYIISRLTNDQDLREKIRLSPTVFLARKLIASKKIPQYKLKKTEMYRCQTIEAKIKKYHSARNKLTCRLIRLYPDYIQYILFYIRRQLRDINDIPLSDFKDPILKIEDCLLIKKVIPTTGVITRSGIINRISSSIPSIDVNWLTSQTHHLAYPNVHSTREFIKVYLNDRKLKDIEKCVDILTLLIKWYRLLPLEKKETLKIYPLTNSVGKRKRR